MVDASVRLARLLDAPDLGAVQSRAWRDAYADLLPPDVLAGLTPESMAAGWRTAVASPPSPRHRVLVAVAGTDVVGFAAFGPTADGDLDGMLDADVSVLLVDPGARLRGHGSRLLSAVVEHLQGDGFRHAHAWVDEADERQRTFLTGAGWAPDGARRSLDLRGDAAVIVRQVRLHTDVASD